MVSANPHGSTLCPFNSLGGKTLNHAHKSAQLAGIAPATAEATEGNKVSIESAATAPTLLNTLEPRLGRSVSIDQAAVLLSVSRRTIYNRIREGRLQTIRTIGGSQRVLVESLHDLGFRPQAFPASAAQASFDQRPLTR